MTIAECTPSTPEDIFETWNECNNEPNISAGGITMSHSEIRKMQESQRKWRAIQAARAAFSEWPKGINKHKPKGDALRIADEAMREMCWPENPQSHANKAVDFICENGSLQSRT